MAMWVEYHSHDVYQDRTFIYVLEKDKERPEHNAVPEQELYEYLGQWLVKQAVSKSQRETRNILDELLWLVPKKRFRNSVWCVPERLRVAAAE